MQPRLDQRNSADASAARLLLQISPPCMDQLHILLQLRSRSRTPSRVARLQVLRCAPAAARCLQRPATMHSARQGTETRCSAHRSLATMCSATRNYSMPCSVQRGGRQFATVHSARQGPETRCSAHRCRSTMCSATGNYSMLCSMGRGCRHHATDRSARQGPETRCSAPRSPSTACSATGNCSTPGSASRSAGARGGGDSRSVPPGPVKVSSAAALAHLMRSAAASMVPMWLTLVGAPA